MKTAIIISLFFCLSSTYPSLACDDQPVYAARAPEPVVSSYYPGYAASLLQPQDIPWPQYNHMDYFVAVPQDGPSLPLILDDKENMRQVVEGAKKNNVSISISIGGWTGSRFFSTNVGDKKNRTLFADMISEFVKTHGFDGVDIDWEYPNRHGAPCNNIHPQDSANLLKFFKLLRAKLGPKARLSAAVPLQGFTGPDGQPISDASDFAKVLDYVTIMAYDIYGPGWVSYSGPLAPLYDTCNDPTNRFSGSQGVETWVAQHFPRSKIILGVPSYGYGYTTLSSKLEKSEFSGAPSNQSLYYQRISTVVPPGGVTSTSLGGVDSCGNPVGNSSNWLFRELIESKKLSRNTRKGLNGYTRHYDSCSRTPFLFSPESKILISYDDPVSLSKKAMFVKAHGLAGVNVFDTVGDTKDNKLLKAINAVLRP